MKISENAIISIKWIDKEISKLKTERNNCKFGSHEYRNCNSMLDIFEFVKENTKPLLPFAKKCYDEGRNFPNKFAAYIDTSEEEVQKNMFLNSTIEIK